MEELQSDKGQQNEDKEILPTSLPFQVLFLPLKNIFFKTYIQKFRRFSFFFTSLNKKIFIISITYQYIKALDLKYMQQK